MRDVPILITLITNDGAGNEMLRQEVLVEMERVRAQIGLQIRIDITTVDRFGKSSTYHRPICYKQNFRY